MSCGLAPSTRGNVWLGRPRYLLQGQYTVRACTAGASCRRHPLMHFTISQPSSSCADPHLTQYLQSLLQWCVARQHDAAPQWAPAEALLTSAEQRFCVVAAAGAATTMLGERHSRRSERLSSAGCTAGSGKQGKSCGRPRTASSWKKNGLAVCRARTKHSFSHALTDCTHTSSGLEFHLSHVRPGCQSRGRF